MNIPEIEEKILAFWQKNKIFEKSLKGRSKIKVKNQIKIYFIKE